MINSSAAAPPLLLQLVLQQQTKLTGIDLVVDTKEALKKKFEQEWTHKSPLQEASYKRRTLQQASYRRRRRRVPHSVWIGGSRMQVTASAEKEENMAILAPKMSRDRWKHFGPKNQYATWPLVHWQWPCHNAIGPLLLLPLASWTHRSIPIRYSSPSPPITCIVPWFCKSLCLLPKFSLYSRSNSLQHNIWY